jgi:threonine dehydrogenase-like Zn-dependent dehydrogenase
MKSVHVTGPGQVEVIDGPEPTLAADQVMLRPITATLARDDVRRVYGGADDCYPLPAGASAHEMVARVVEAKYTARQWREFEAGELVAFYGTQAVGLAETVVVPHSTVYWLPPAEDPDLQAVPTARPLGQVIEACNTFPPLTTACAAVIGQGSSGLLFDALLARMGAGVVAGIDTRPERVSAAERFGATLALVPGTETVKQVQDANGGFLADVVVETSGTTAGLRIAVELVRPGGRLHLFGAPNESPYHLDAAALTEKRFEVQASGAGIEDASPYWSPYGAAMNLVLRGEVDTRPLLTHRFPLEQAAEAFALARSGNDGALKVSIDHGDS